jgi:hypothetical protein
VEEATEESGPVMLKRRRASSRAVLIRDKAATMLGMKAQVKIKKEVVKRLLVFQMLGITGFKGVPPNARVRLKIRILTAKVDFSVPYVEDVQRFPPQTASISTYDPSEEVAHIFVQYKSALKYGKRVVDLQCCILCVRRPVAF